jgi:long-subunit fatty acid transport protein
LGLIDQFDKRELLIRSELWKAAGFHIEDSKTRYQVKQATVKGKRFALVMLYKVWSAFSKGLRYTFVTKQQAVNLPKIGVFYNQQTSEDALPDVTTVFCASKEVSKAVGCE